MRSPLCLPDTLRCRLSASFAKRAILRHEQGRSRSDVMSVARKSYSIHNSSSWVFAGANVQVVVGAPGDEQSKCKNRSAEAEGESLGGRENEEEGELSFGLFARSGGG